MTRAWEELGIGLLALAGAGLYHHYGEAYLSGAVLGKQTAGIYVQVVSGAMGLCGLVCLCKAGLIWLRRTESAGKGAFPFGRVGILACILGCYIFALPYLGFLVASIPAATALLFVMGERQWSRLACYPTAFTLALYLLFGQMLQIQLPTLF